MKKQYHILNGDALKAQFPKEIQGEILVARECLVDGDVSGHDLDELFRSRARFISQSYNISEQDYFDKTVPEFLKMKEIEKDSDINLWFEDDLFCQVNFWFVVHLLRSSLQHNSIFLVRPQIHSPYGFGGLQEFELISICENRVALIELDQIASLWESYQHGDAEELVNTARALKDKLPFILPAVEAHLERRPVNGHMGRPIQSLMTIIDELQTDEFGPIFRVFNERESIYGFGDLHVHRLFNEIRKK